MKAWIKYRLSRLIVLLVALHTLDASVDLDYITNTTGWFDVVRYDDIDSISEFVLETVFHNANLFTENNNDDRPHSKHHHLSQNSIIIFSDRLEDWNVTPSCKQLNIFRPSLRNISFQFEDHSSPDYNPPELSHTQAC